MEQKIPEALLPRLSEFTVASLGLHFPSARWSDLERGLVGAAADFDFGDVKEFCHWLLTTPLTKSQIGKLAIHLTVGETYFFREPKSYEALGSAILPELIRARRDGERNIRLWSAACATGEEAYSLAITVTRTIADLEKWNVTILATDINPHFLQKALTGIYSNWSFRNTPEWVKSYYFNKQANGRYMISPEIKRLVTFEPLNLVEDIYPSLLNQTNALDIIFCRNVLMYFAPEQIDRVINRLRQSLVPGGWLAASPAEASHRFFKHFELVEFPGATFYRKASDSPLPRQSALPAQLNLQENKGWVFPISTGMPDEQQQANGTLLPLADAPESESEDTAAFDIAKAVYRQGGNQAAQGTTETARTLRPEASESLLISARDQANQGKLHDAYASCQKAILADRLDPKCYYLLAIIAGELGMESEARGAFRQALYLDPDFIVAHYALGVLAKNQGKQTEATKHFAAALKLLERQPSDNLLPEGDGLTAGRLNAIIRAAGGGSW